MSTRLTSGTSHLFSEELIHAQVQRIFNCPAFSVSDILRRFLTYIIDETLSGRSNTIKEYTIAVNVLHKPVSFKPQHDAIVRIHAGRLRRALNYYYKEQGLPDPIEISVPKGSYVPVFGDMQMKEINQETDGNADQPIHSKDLVTLVIMPFRTFETDTSRMAFTDSLGQQLSSEFGRFSDFSVISYYTTQQLKFRNREISELASHFGAQYVVTGNVQFEARRLRVAVQLTDANTGAQIWSELHHRNYTIASLFEIGDQIVTSLAGALGDFNGIITQQVSNGLTKTKSGITVSTMLSVYHDFYTFFDESSFIKAHRLIKDEILVNRSNEIAWAFLGELSLLSFLFNQTTEENPLIHGLRCARKALKINPLSQHGHITLGMAYLHLNNKQLSLDALEMALTLNPNASGTTGIIGCLMISLGEYNRGIILIRKSIELNKSYPSIFNLFISLYHFKQKEYAQAYEQVEIMSMPDLFLNIILRLSILVRMGRKTEINILVKSLRNKNLNKTWISREYISRFLLDQELIEQLFEGLKSVNIPILTVA